MADNTPIVQQIANLTQESSVIQSLNTNFNNLRDYVKNLLSTVSGGKNTMNVALDMNGQRIINLPTPSGLSDPLRLQDVTLFKGDKGDKGEPGRPGNGTSPGSIPAFGGLATLKGDLPVTDTVIHGLPPNGGSVVGTNFAGSPLQFYSVGGYVPGPHLYGQVVIAMQTERNYEAQEQGLAIQMINSTGKPPPDADQNHINNGKSAFTIATRTEPGGGNSWGAAIATDIAPGVGNGFFATIEVDTNNFNATSDVGSGPQVAGIFFNTYSTYSKLAALWLTGFEPSADSPRTQKYWQYGMLVQSSNMIARDMFGIFTGTTNVLHAGAGHSHSNAVIYDESNGPYGYLCTGTRSSSTLSLQDNSPVGLDVAGIKGAFGIRARDSAPVGISVQGTRSSAAIDVSQAITGVGLALKEGQSIKFGDSFDIYVANAKVYIRRTSDGSNIFSVDTNGTVRCSGPIIGNTTP